MMEHFRDTHVGHLYPKILVVKCKVSGFEFESIIKYENET